MGNRITNKQVHSDSLKMSNGTTSVLVSVLALSACDAAESGWEKRFAQFIVDMDQSYRGLGAVGFDISEIGWNPEAFEKQKQYILKVIDMAMNEYRWDALSYSPVTKVRLKQFREMIEVFQKQHIDLAFAWPLNHENIAVSRCPQHHIYLNLAGCLLCNDKSIQSSMGFSSGRSLT